MLVKGVIIYTKKRLRAVRVSPPRRVRLDVPAWVTATETVQMNDFKGFFTLDTLYHDTAQHKLRTLD